MQPVKLTLTIVPLAAFLAFAAQCAEFVRVAYDDAGAPDSQPHLIQGEDWNFQAPGIATPAAQSCTFGAQIVFGYDNLQPQAAYKVRLTFFADEARVMSIKAGNMAIGQARAEKHKTTLQEFMIPAAAINDKKLTLVLEQISGPNAVVSEIEIFSDNPAPLGPIPRAEVVLPAAYRLESSPRLSPQPKSVAGVAKPVMDLGGIWNFTASLPEIFPPANRLDEKIWKKITVPGEWAMQGFDVKPGTAAGYVRSFTIPKDWAGKRIKLRCDAVYSDAMVYINERRAGQHSGGFTPFELDVTSLLNPAGPNSIAFSVLNESTADALASGSKYACHQLGGITRGIRLIALPEHNISSVQIITRFDSSYQDATLDVALEAEADGTGLVPGLFAELSLSGPDGKTVKLSQDRIALDSLKGRISLPVSNPAKWDCEHPRLYTLTIRLKRGADTLETIVRQVGFRQVEVRGNELYVNGRPVKLRGSNHHEVYPLTGRSLPAGIHRRDIELFREANVNLLRTCHYPPDEALMEAADELGMFIECEAPFCWSPGSGHNELVVRQTAEMVVQFRNHPSVLFWSLANESSWGSHFAAASRTVRELDPTRPQTFNWGSGAIQTVEEKFTDIANGHYPGHDGPAQARRYIRRPVYLGEDSHLNAYNRLELATDPALRDLWGKYLRELWNDIYNTKGCLGQSIWSGVDDTFYMKDDQTVGYGTWGPIDGWRRPKPEYWVMKKAYSPICLIEPETIAWKDGLIAICVENRQNFSDLREMKFSWKLGKQSGTTTADIAPGARGDIVVHADKPPKPGDRLELTVTDPRGFLADQFSITLAGIPDRPSQKAGVRSAPTFTQTPAAFMVKCGPTTWQISRSTGKFLSANALAVSGPQLMLLPLNNSGETQMTGKTKVWTPFTEPCSGWTCSRVSANQQDHSVVVTVEGKYIEAEGFYTITFSDTAPVEIAYDFTVLKALNPRQVGLVFTLPHKCEVLSWNRKGYWDFYPEDHIARLKGTVRASEGFEATSVGPRTKPSHPWRLDSLPYGNNDFCSTKHNFITATIADTNGKGLEMDGRGTQHVRCWRTASAVNVLVADYSNGGSERFLRGMASKDDRPLKAGSRVTGTVRLTPAE